MNGYMSGQLNGWIDKNGWMTYLKLAFIWLLVLVHPLYLQVREWSRKLYKRIRESFDVTNIYTKTLLHLHSLHLPNISHSPSHLTLSSPGKGSIPLIFLPLFFPWRDLTWICVWYFKCYTTYRYLLFYSIVTSVS